MIFICSKCGIRKAFGSIDFRRWYPDGTYIPVRYLCGCGEEYVATATAISSHYYDLKEPNIQVNRVVNLKQTPIRGSLVFWWFRVKMRSLGLFRFFTHKFK